MSKKSYLTKPQLFSGLLTFIAIISLAISPSSYAAAVTWPKEINLGYQKYGPLIVLKSTGELEKRLKEHGVAVKWSEFPAGLPMLEALNAGALDFAVTGETPPVFAQASKGSPIVYVANEPASPQAEGIIVKADSDLKDVTDLKGKKVTVPKGSNSQFFLIQALAKAGLTWNDIEPAYLAPADARAALERGDVAAWSIWDYYYSAAEIQLGTRTLTNGEGLVQNYAFYTSRRDFADKYPELIKTVLDEIGKTDEWIKSKPVEAAEKLAIDIGVDAKILEKALLRSNFGPQSIKPEVIAAQQKIADTLFAIKLLPKQINVEDAVWQPKK